MDPDDSGGGFSHGEGLSLVKQGQCSILDRDLVIILELDPYT